MVYLSTEDITITKEITYEELLALGESYVKDLQPDDLVRVSLFRCLSDIFIQLPSFLFLKECSLSHETPTSWLQLKFLAHQGTNQRSAANSRGKHSTWFPTTVVSKWPYIYGFHLRYIPFHNLTISSKLSIHYHWLSKWIMRYHPRVPQDSFLCSSDTFNCWETHKLFWTYKQVSLFKGILVDILRPQMRSGLLYRGLTVSIQFETVMWLAYTHFIAGSLRRKTPQDRNGFESKNVRRWNRGINFSLISNWWIIL